MNELRTDVLSGDQVIIASERRTRPRNYTRTTWRTSVDNCPFCPGNEHESPLLVAAFDADGNPIPGQDDWKIRVVRNLYPAVIPADADEPNSVPSSRLCPAVPALGEQEVIIDCNRHVSRLTDMTVEEIAGALSVYAQRLTAHKKQGQVFGQLFKNMGPDAGATIHHTHAQLVALPFVPERPSRILEICRDYFDRHGASLLGDLTDYEEQAACRIVARTNTYVAYCPFASHVEFQIRIVPRRHQPRFEDSSATEFRELGQFLRKILVELEKLHENPGINVTVNTAPFDSDAYDYYHWHIDVFPRLSRHAGLEFSTGLTVNAVAPELAASALCSRLT